jgi:hypothetical protein
MGLEVKIFWDVQELNQALNIASDGKFFVLKVIP